VVNVSRIFGEQLFPERQLLLKSSGGVRHIALPSWLQAMVLTACLVSVGGIGYLAWGFARLHDAVDQRIDEARYVTSGAAAAANDTAAIDELRRDLATVNQNYGDVNARYQDAQAKLGTLSADNDKLRNDLTAATTRMKTAQDSKDKLGPVAAENDKLRTELGTTTARLKNLQDARDDAERRAKTAEQALNSKAQLAKNLDDNKSELRQSEAERTTLQNRVQQLQMELQAANNRAAQLASQLERQGQSPQIATDPARTLPAAPAPAAPLPTDSMKAPDITVPVPDRKPDGGPRAQGGSELERLLASTGLDIDRLLGALPSQAAQGGPYIALGDARAPQIDQKREEELKKLAKMLPLNAPLPQYQFESPFGARIDPINHRTAFHPGLDLAAPYKSPVYSTAPGRVVFTGERDSYGRMVEIDHGHGIVTRYAHLHKILVARGQQVGGHTPIGELGSTGRSTGPHVHYEVLVEGTPLDPAKFMEAGKNVVQINSK
jgi:murein DD-endopeptidase MepM/ murein hydrolase activator NlpD